MALTAQAEQMHAPFGQSRSALADWLRTAQPGETRRVRFV
jgi:hypothetical protein